MLGPLWCVLGFKQSLFKLLGLDHRRSHTLDVTWLRNAIVIDMEHAQKAAVPMTQSSIDLRSVSVIPPGHTFSMSAYIDTFLRLDATDVLVGTVRLA